MLAKAWNKQKRIDNPSVIDETLIDGLISDGYLVIVQFSKPCFDQKILKKIDQLCTKYGVKFAVRFYGFYSGSFNFRTLRSVPNVKNLHVDCLIRAENIVTLSELEHLLSLNFGVFETNEFELLSFPNLGRLRQLILGQTRHKSYDLAPLRGFDSLETLTIESHTKNIGAVGELDRLRYLGLSSIKRTSLEFVNSLKSLKSLFIILGGRANIDEIQENQIEELEIIWVRGFNELRNLERFRKLKKLYVEDQIRLESIPFNEEMPFLQELWAINCKNLTSITGLTNLRALKKLHFALTKIDYFSFLKQEMPASLESLYVFTGKERLNDKIKNEIVRRGYPSY